MKELVFAVISICLSSGDCQTHQMKVEPRVCQLRQVHAKVPMDGEWKDATINFKC